QWLGANPAPAISGRDVQPGKVNYFLGNDPSKWRTNVATYGQLVYNEIYPGIDLVYYGNSVELEYDFVVAPGADPGQVRLAFVGADGLTVAAAGDLVVQAGGQTMRQHKPVIYQDVAGRRQEVAGMFEARGQEVGFTLGAYNPGLPLVIDPVLSYSTFFGGSA